MTMIPHTSPPRLPRLAPAARRGWVPLGAGVLIGLVVAYAWSHHFVDNTTGDNVANALLGYDAEETVLGGLTAGALFALVTGLAGTFTACNVAAVSALPAMLRTDAPASSRLRQALPALGWLACACLAVAMAYGAVGATLADRLPQLSEATTGSGMPVRLLQSSVVFGVIGAILLYLGAAVSGVLPNPMPQGGARALRAWMLLMGALIGAFLIGRPFPLFRKLFAHAAEQGDPLYGAAVFGLQSLGNIALLAAVFLLVAGPGAPVQRWLTARPGRAARITGATLAAAGSFTLFYWAVRIPAAFGYGWFPSAPWN